MTSAALHQLLTMAVLSLPQQLLQPLAPDRHELQPCSRVPCCAYTGRRKRVRTQGIGACMQRLLLERGQQTDACYTGDAITSENDAAARCKRAFQSTPSVRQPHSSRCMRSAKRELWQHIKNEQARQERVA
jgi:hypothetical protein